MPTQLYSNCSRNRNSHTKTESIELYVLFARSEEKAGGRTGSRVERNAHHMVLTSLHFIAVSAELRTLRRSESRDYSILYGTPLRTGLQITAHIFLRVLVISVPFGPFAWRSMRSISSSSSGASPCRPVPFHPTRRPLSFEDRRCTRPYAPMADEHGVLKGHLASCS